MGIKMYKKEKSFSSFHTNIAASSSDQRARAIRLVGQHLKAPNAPWEAILVLALKQLQMVEGASLALTPMVADEMSRTADKDIPRYVYHRYRYDCYPVQRVADDYPPYLQVEPASICNYRCVFCYQVNKSLTDRKNGHMGTMPFALFQKIMDEAKGHVDFLSLASRGEPLVAEDIDKMLAYCSGKFLGLKVNTNAALLNEARCHAILSGGVNTVVFSVDAADAEQYARMRVNGVLEKVEENIRLFERVRKAHYSRSPIISRISGVKYQDRQDMETMAAHWGDCVDQVCFVNYNAWENVYDALPNGLDRPCSDLWRRMFIWFDGKANPCDVDYLSSLSVGSFPEKSIKELWHSETYNILRHRHTASERNRCEPCQRCSVV